MMFRKVKNWERFQHYRYRNPPWIRLHQEILISDDWVMLADASKLLAVVCMVLAARHHGHVPDDPHYIKRVAYLDTLPDLGPLISCGFLSETLATASECKQVLATRAPEYRVQSTERKKDKSTTAKTLLVPQRGNRITTDWTPSPEVLLFSQNKIGHESTASELASFRDYWAAVPGAKGVKLDWDATFRNWVRNSLKFKQERKRNGDGSHAGII